MFDKIIEENMKKSYEFEKLFFPGVKIRRKSSKVIWTIIGTVDSLFNKVAKAKSPSGYTRYIHTGQYSQFEVIYIPPAYKVLFSEKTDNKEE